MNKERQLNKAVVSADYAALEFEEGTDAAFDRYFVEVRNGDGYYDEDGWFHRYKEPDY